MDERCGVLDKGKYVGWDFDWGEGELQGKGGGNVKVWRENGDGEVG